MWRDDLDRTIVMKALSRPCLALPLSQAILGRDVPEIPLMAGVFSALPNIGDDAVWEQFLVACDEVTDGDEFGRALASLCAVDENVYLGAIAQATALSELATEPSDFHDVCLPIVERFEIERDWDSELVRACQQGESPEPDARVLEAVSGSLTIVLTSRAVAELSEVLTVVGAHDAMRRAAEMLAGTGFTLELLLRPLPAFDGR